MKLPEPNGGSFTPTPEGQHNAVCTRFIDLGTQTQETAWGTKSLRKILIGWEIPAHRIKMERDGREVDLPVLHYERMTFSTHEKATFRQRLESWRGKPFQDSDFGNHEGAFDVRNLLGVGALIQITHKHENGRIYSNMTAIMMPPGGKDAWVKPEGEIIYVALTPEDFDPDAFAKLSENLQNTISASPEYSALFESAPSENPGAGMSEPELEDEIPF